MVVSFKVNNGVGCGNVQCLRCVVPRKLECEDARSRGGELVDAKKRDVACEFFRHRIMNCAVNGKIEYGSIIYMKMW